MEFAARIDSNLILLHVLFPPSYDDRLIYPRRVLAAASQWQLMPAAMAMKVSWLTVVSDERLN